MESLAIVGTVFGIPFLLAGILYAAEAIWNKIRRNHD